MQMSKSIISDIFHMLKIKGSNLQYGNEDVTQLEHALQCAQLAERNKCSKEIITAALLHDIGHLLYRRHDPIHEDKDGHHENLGADYLSQYFNEEITLPIRAHVDSKRYLAKVEKEYYNLLSEASKKSLTVQGGPFTKEEAHEFINRPFMKQAVELRRYDDQAKILNKKTPNLDYFRPYVEKCLNQV